MLGYQVAGWKTYLHAADLLRVVAACAPLRLHLALQMFETIDHKLFIQYGVVSLLIT